MIQVQFLVGAPAERRSSVDRRVRDADADGPIPSAPTEREKEDSGVRERNAAHQRICRFKALFKLRNYFLRAPDFFAIFRIKTGNANTSLSYKSEVKQTN